MALLDAFRPRRRSYRPSFESLEARDCPSVAVPSGFTLTALSPTQVKVAWADVANETGYRVYRWNGTQAVTVATLNQNITTFTVNGLAANQLYYFYVQAFDGATTGRTAWASVRTLANVLTAPTNLRAGNVTTNQVSLAWNDSTNETGYRIYTWKGSAAVQIGTVGANVLSFQVNNLTPGTVNYYFVRAFNATNTATTGWLTVTTQAVSMTAPTNLRAALTANDKIQLNWNDAVGETGYRVYRWDGGATTPFVIATLAANTTSYQSTGLQFGRQYYYYVQAFNASNVANSTWVDATTPANVTLLAPTGFQVTQTSATGALLTWNDAAGAAGYRVYTWTGYAWALLTTVPQGTQRLQLSNLPTSRTHWFTLQAYTDTSSQIANTAAMFVNL